MNSGRYTRFFKLEGLANDFVLIDARDQDFRLDTDEIRRWADRRTGIGFDQMLVLHPDATALARVEIRNADGSSAEQCGNGMRAIAAWLEERNELGAGVALETPAGPVDISRNDNGLFTALLPAPTDLDPERLGLEPPMLADGGSQPTVVSMGNPHVIITADREPTVASLADAVDSIEQLDGWRNAANISLAHPKSGGAITLRVHERGVGPTAACGSAACAAAWVIAGQSTRSGPIEVRQPGGSLVVDFDRDSGRVASTGPAHLVFEGHIR